MTDKTDNEAVKSQAGKTQAADRRDFLRLMSVGVVTGGAVLAQTTSGEAASVEAAGPTDGYRETDHVRRYYELAR
jgi:hypothetical protein